MGIFNIFSSSSNTDNSSYKESIHPLKGVDIEGNEISFSEYAGKIVLIVNTASRCGFTSQYKDLEELYATYKDRNFIILGFPSNDFLGQEPGADAEIKDFCEINYKVTFPLFAKASVTGKNKQPVFKILTEQSGDTLNGSVRWNFEKFLVGRDGKLIARWRSITNPKSNKIIKEIEKILL